MRQYFAKTLIRYMTNDVHFITADLGFKIFDSIENNHPNNFHRLGASEQLMIGMAVGMAYEGMIPIAYSISTFALFRAYEFIRNYAFFEGLPIKIVGSGLEKDYKHDGITHWLFEDELKSIKEHSKSSVFRKKEFQIYLPNTNEELEDIFEEFLFNDNPSFLGLRK